MKRPFQHLDKLPHNMGIFYSSEKQAIHAFLCFLNEYHILKLANRAYSVETYIAAIKKASSMFNFLVSKPYAPLAKPEFSTSEEIALREVLTVDVKQYGIMLDYLQTGLDVLVEFCDTGIVPERQSDPSEF